MEVSPEIEEAIAAALEAGSLRAAAKMYPAHSQAWESAADDASARAATLVAGFARAWSRQGARH